MSEFERARQRAERRAAKKPDYSQVSDEVEREPEVVAKDVVKAPKKRSNEINVAVWIDGNEYTFAFKTNITGTILSTQQSHRGMQHIILEALRSKFGTVELV